MKINRRSLLRLALVTLVVGCLGCGGSTSGTGGVTIEGKLLTVTSTPISGVTVTVLDTGDSSVTDSTGGFLIETLDTLTNPEFLFEGSGINARLRVAEIEDDVTSVTVKFELNSGSVRSREVQVRARRSGEGGNDSGEDDSDDDSDDGSDDGSNGSDDDDGSSDDGDDDDSGNSGGGGSDDDGSADGDDDDSSDGDDDDNSSGGGDGGGDDGGSSGGNGGGDDPEQEEERNDQQPPPATGSRHGLARLATATAIVGRHPLFASLEVFFNRTD